MALPAQVTYATVTGVLTSAVVDGSDVDLLPDAVPLSGQVTFTPDKVNGQLLVPTATPKLMVTVRPMPFALAGDGSFSANLVVIPGATYTVSFALNNGVSIEPYSIGPLVAGQTYDLASLAPTVAMDGVAYVIQATPATDASIAAYVTTAPAGLTRTALNAAFVDINKQRGNGFVALGDSISTAADMGTGGGGYGAPWPHMACVLSNQRLNFLGNAGVSGQNSTQILARVPDVLALKPQIVTVLAGTNDITQAVTFATWSANIKTIATTLRTAGIRVVLCTMPPRGNTTYLTATLAWNRWLVAYAQQNGYDLLDFFTLLVNPLTGMYTAGYDSGDALHPHQTAHLLMANLALSQIQTSAFAPVQAQTNTLDPANLVVGPLLATGTPTPGSFITTGSATADWVEGLVTDTDFKGKAWQVAFTNALSAGNFRSFKTYLVSTGFSPGDVILMTMREKVTVATNIVPSGIAGLRWRINAPGGTPAVWTPVGADGTVHAAGLFSFRFVVTAGTTSLQLETVVGTIPVGASFTSLVGEFGMFNLTTGALLVA